MSWKGRSLLSIDDLSTSDIDRILALARFFKKSLEEKKYPLHQTPHPERFVVSEVFFETSTRTRLSFQMAAQRLGLKSHGMDMVSGSSLKKGESVVETLNTLAAMKPDVMVVRSSGGPDVEARLETLPIAVVNAGVGTKGHPTQALLDAFTLLEKRPTLKNFKLLLVGDIRHSRVANSNLQLLSRMGAELAFCAPENFLPQAPEWSSLPSFAKLEDGLKWCDAVMGLRVQEERHQDSGFRRADYVRDYLLHPERLKSLSPQGMILHPGPFVAGLDLLPEVLNDPRTRIHEQVQNGVFIRMSVLSLILGLEVAA